MGHVGRLYDNLISHFGADLVLMDVDAARMAAGLSGVRAVLVVIGPDWLSDKLAERNDVVRREVADALAAGTPVIPVLVRGASMPEAALLPPELETLAMRHALVLRDRTWTADVANLIKSLDALLAS
jgi:hypothetical protein